MKKTQDILIGDFITKTCRYFSELNMLYFIDISNQFLKFFV